MIVSYSTQRMKHGVFIISGAYVLALLICLPSWPFYNKNQLKWLKFKEEHKIIKEKKE
ncbi:MAG: signal peptidase complex subunit 1 family protein [archaeon]|nr:signal peptidase complex subunit 1 family protein [archaeon]